ncbi:MAG: peptide chain release factor N(5)-glutamine methyltransferase [Octadecabacter sp.]|nr:peptide chain release factor N(5)-glutamine methyltransferase [Octadecabacter sp.]
MYTITDAAKHLRSAGIADGAREARQIWASIFPANYTDHGEMMDGVFHRRFSDQVNLRASRVPMSHVLGKRAFYEHTFKVTPDVLDPRPDTEALVIAALEKPWDRMLDLGTGSGAIAISLLAAREGTTGVATDKSAAALKVASQNAHAIEVAERLVLVEGSWFEPIDKTFDLIVSNPPYITKREMRSLSPEVLHEPRMALTDEGDGLSCYRIIAAGAPEHLNAGGWLMVEIGPTQAADVIAMFEVAGLQNVAIRRDLDGRDRVIVGQKPL